MSFDPSELDCFPTAPGVYLMKDESGSIIYIGKAKHLRSRLKQYFSKGGDTRAMIPFLRSKIAGIDTVIVSSEKEALLLENTLIKRHQPKYNAILKDDRTFISLMINHRHRWPMIRLIRYKGKPKEGHLYFGPYTNAFAARQTFELLIRLFPLRQCSDEELKRRTRPCLLYSIKRCIAPCANLCSKEEYDTFVQGAIRFLRGENREILKELREAMELASSALEFEKAAALLQTIRQIEEVTTTEQHVVRAASKDCDAISFYRQGHDVMLVQLFFRQGNLVGSEHYSFENVLEEDEELLESFIMQHYKSQADLPEEIVLPLPLKNLGPLSEIISEVSRKKISLCSPQKGGKRELIELAAQNAQVIFAQKKDHQELKEKMLLDLQETLKLNRYPKRIECFDTSNLAGSDLVASMVAFTDGEKDRKRMRLFKIKDISKPDDYGALHQVLSRRLMRAKDETDLPDLLVIDGGRGQLNVALDVFRELDIASVDVIALAKEEGRHDKGLRIERIFLSHHKDPIFLNPRSPLLFFLQKIRDEAHEKAIAFHRKRRQMRNIKSSLDELPGIGPIKRKRLLTAFGSVERIKKASLEELSKIPGLTKKDLDTLSKLK
ncbi:MAG: excinuclease ABC subunit UvrC [Anaerolineae bacterium]